MFIRYFLELPLPAEQVETSLLGPAARWLEGLATDASRRGEALLAEIQVGPLRPHLARPVRIHLGDPTRLAAATSLPMSWEPVGETLLPTLEADLEVGALGPARTQLAISARYRPPLGRQGRFADRVLLHWVAEATVKDFLDRVGEAIQAAVEATAPPPIAAVAAKPSNRDTGPVPPERPAGEVARKPAAAPLE